MNNLKKYTIDSYTSSHQDINSFGEFARVPTAIARVINNSKAAFKPKAYVTDHKEHWHFISELPGVSKDDLEVLKKGNTLTIKGIRKISGAEPFSLNFDFPFEFNSNGFKTELADGVLDLTLFKKPALKKVEDSKKLVKINLLDLLFGFDNTKCPHKAS